uniref:Protein IQ-DOMAIN 1 n=2 Tax=Cajanus cajan TaxID=3821 RepID=A0A151S4X8_CAJCA|nr:Protein IQ-DOMAIN 1 [Cajanus cajan]
MTMRCMQALVRVQARVRARRLQLSHVEEKQQFEKKKEKPELEPEPMPMPMSPMRRTKINDWDSRRQSSHKIKENELRKHEAVMKRGRALSYAFDYQQQQQKQFLLADNDLGATYEYDREKAQWGWNWLENWMSSQPCSVKNVGLHETSYRTLTSTTSTTTDNMSEKTMEMDMLATVGPTNISPINQDFIDSSPVFNRHHQIPPSPNRPSYMAPTQSTKAKVRAQGPSKMRASPEPQWNFSTKEASTCDSSSSGGGIAGYQFPRSPGPKMNATRSQSRRIVDKSEDWALPLGAHGWI